MYAKKTIITLFVCLIMLSLLSSCSFFQRKITIKKPVTIQSDENCIGSFDGFAFSTPDLDGPSQEVIQPAGSWKIEASLPGQATAGADGYVIAVLRSVENRSEVWMQPYHPSIYYTEKDAKNYHFMIYETHAKTWQRVDAKVGNTNVFVDQLFVTGDGSIWGRNVWDHTLKLIGIPALSRYDETKKQFEFDPGTSQIPNGLFDPNNGSINKFPYWDVIALDKNNTFWLFALKDAIYRYDPTTQKGTRRASLKGFQEIRDITLAPDGSFYFRNVDTLTQGFTLQDGQIYQYLPAKDQILPLRLPNARWPAPNSIFADHAGRLWLGVFGWTKPTGEWKLLDPETNAFIRLNKDLPLWNRYQPPFVEMESSNGRLWFVIPRSEEWRTLRSGIAWYDPNTNKGCWFTSEGYGVGEDAEHTIWLSAGGKLYHYLPDE